MRSITTTISTSTQANRVHILGLGSIGNFVAHSLSEIPNGPSVTLLLHRKSLLDAYKKTETKYWYDFETLHDGEWYRTSAGEPDSESYSSASPITDVIDNLIICVKATQTVDALRPIHHRLTSQSNILFLQNGSGMIEEVNAHLFTNPNKRPSYLIGVISHGVTLNSPFNITHTGFSATSVGPVPRESVSSTLLSNDCSTDGPPTTNHLLQTLTLSPRLNLTSYSYTSILQIQLEKLAVNAFCNPLCALNDSRNGFLFTIPETRREILTEISDVVLALPELKHALGLEERFSVDNLENTVNGIIQKT
ncbi:putative 2-dehydropantoate 2-reductase [Lipomyces doorenjongii]